MTLSEFKSALSTSDSVDFLLPNGTAIPQHFHVTEVGLVNKRFIDCGGTTRHETKVSLQLWEARDTDHRLPSKKLQSIIALSQKTLGITDDLDVEVEYQGETIGRYGLDFDGAAFSLTPMHTACLASDACGVPKSEKKKVALAALGEETVCCTPGGSCC